MKPELVPVPDRMSLLPRDRRGYPIPVNVARDRDGQPAFTVNNAEVVERLFREDRCGICGQKLLRGRWSVGGPGSAFHEDGAFIDPPMHRECATYALMVCPYLALSSYRKPISGLEPGQIKVDWPQWVTHNPSQENDKPPLFVSVMYVAQKLNKHRDGSVRSLTPRKPYRQIEYWAGGERLDDAEGREVVRRYLEGRAEEWERQKRRALGTG